MTKKTDDEGNKSGGAVCTLKVSAMTLTPKNEITLWCPDIEGHNHLVKIYNDGAGTIRIEPISAKLDIRE